MTTRLAPRYIGYIKGNTKDPKVIVEAFIDVLCPFSTKAFLTLEELVEKETGIQLRVIHLVQPWHPQSTHLTCNVAQAYFDSGDEAAFKSMRAIMTNQTTYSDEAVSELTTKQLKDQVGQFTGHPFKDEDFQRIDRWMKNQQKYARQNSVHMTPSVAINGLMESEASSSWTLQQWQDFLKPIL